MNYKDHVIHALTGTNSLTVKTVTSTIIKTLKLNKAKWEVRTQARNEIRAAILELQREGKIASSAKRIWLPK